MFQRTIVTLSYIVVCVCGSIMLAYLFASTECYKNDYCNKQDQIIFAAVGVLDFVMAFVLLVVGLKGKLPGTRTS